MAGKGREVGIVHGVGFEAGHAGAEFGETLLAATGDDDDFLFMLWKRWAKAEPMLEVPPMMRIVFLEEDIILGGQ